MTVVDERGRLFGLVNIIDIGVAAVVVAVVAMVAVGFSIFRVPATPEFTSIEPRSQPQNGPLRLIVRGKNFLPFMKAVVQRTGDSRKAVNDVTQNPNMPLDRYALVTQTEARFFVESPLVGEVWLPGKIEPGTYDLALVNESKVVVVKESAFVVTPAPEEPPPPAPPPPPPAPLATVRMYGMFSRVERPGTSIAVGTKFTTDVPGESAEVVSRGAVEPDIINIPVPAVVADTVKIPAMLRVRCSFSGGDCRYGSTVIAPSIWIDMPYKNHAYRFFVSELVADNSPLANVRVTGAFARLDAASANAITAGTKLTSAVPGEAAEVLSVGPTEPDLTRAGGGDSAIPASVEGALRLPATLRLRCSFTGSDCRIYTTKLARSASITLNMGGKPYTFVIADLVPDVPETYRQARVAVRLVMRPELAALIKQGDVDTPRAQPTAAPGAERAPAARITAVGPRREGTSATQIPVSEASLQTFNVQEPVVLVDVTLSVPVTDSGGAWTYKGQPVKAGGAMTFETPQYVVRGYIISVAVDETSPAIKR